MPLQDRFHPGEPVADLNHLARERLETGFEAREAGVYVGFESAKAILDAGKAVLDARKARTERVVLHNASDHVQHDGEHGHTDSEIELTIRHARAFNLADSAQAAAPSHADLTKSAASPVPQ